ncbi:hypothetical protein MNBD_ALPHA03-1474 [hydrothermal vent metagenome]|uniref:Uncharacterized protein n=1 Tax=hydrothermal vent metagenome TaxID=652676 RepID=A0A3B1BB31_9ZZZZ
MIIECTSLCISSSIKQTYRGLWHYKFQHVVISILAVLPFCLAGLSGLLDPVSTASPSAQGMPDGFNLSFAMLVGTTLLWAVPMTILWQRLYLLGPEHLIRRKVWPLITRSLKLINHSLIFFGLVLVAGAAITWGVLYLRIFSGSEEMMGTITKMGDMEYALYASGLLAMVIFLLIFSLRFSLAFSSLTIGKSLRFTTSWRMTRKNTFRMLITTLLTGLPILAIYSVLLWAAKYYFNLDLLAGTAQNPDMDPDMIYIFILVFAPLLSLPLATFCSLTSTFYRHCGCPEFSEQANH